jgi:hypothetical protein
MIVLRQSRYDLLLLGIVVVLSIAANLPDQYAPFDKRVLIAALVVIIGVSLIRYVRVSLVLVTAVLVLASNLPGEMAAQFGIDKNILLITLCAMVAIAVFNHYLKKIPTGDEPAYRAKSLHGAAALFSAVMKGNVKGVQTLIRSGVNVNVRTLTGKTLLMAASFKGYTDIVQMLLNSGANANSRDAEGTTALSIARHQGYSRIVAFLKMAGADDSPQYLDVASLTRLSDN